MEKLIFAFNGTAGQYLSEFHSSCDVCQGSGKLHVANGEHDYDDEICISCDGTGKVIESTN